MRESLPVRPTQVVFGGHAFLESTGKLRRFIANLHMFSTPLLLHELSECLPDG